MPITTINGFYQIRDASIPQTKLNLSTPVSPSDAATKAYVDAFTTGLDVKASVRVASTANVTIASPPTTIDGVTLAIGNRILLKAQTAGAENGIYQYNGAGVALTRTSDANTSAQVTAGLFTFIEEGATFAGNGWVLTTPNPITLGTTALTFSQFSGTNLYSAGVGLTLTGTTFSVQWGSPTGISVPGDSNTQGTATISARSDHKHSRESWAYETPSGTVDGSNAAFTLAHTPLTPTVAKVFVNGLLMDPGAGNDYTLSGTTITFLTGAIPQTNDKVRAHYFY